ncbi:hypothetical protein A2T76_10075 [Pseudomonas brenneri]|nr:hypothetical protein A2T76_10075 [Pseudomonas brenneri]
MQAVYALLDELGDLTCRDQPPLSVWRDLAYPNIESTPHGWDPDAFVLVKRLAEGVTFPLSAQEWKALRNQACSLAPHGESAVRFAGANWLAKRLQHQRVVKLLGDLQESPAKVDRLVRSLANRLALTIDDMNLLMWSHPRPLMLGAIPTTVRRLASNWRASGEQGKDYQAGHPLPDFIPASLFADLSLPEMRIEWLARNGSVEEQYLPVQHGLAEFAPGRVSRRYDDALWLGVDGPALARFFACGSTEVSEDIEVSTWYDLEPQRNFFVQDDSDRVTFKAFRPAAARLSSVARGGNGAPELSDTSNAQLQWKSFLQAPYQGVPLTSPTHIGISQLIKRVVVHTHAEQSNAFVRRYAVSSRAELRLRSGSKSERVTVDWQFMHSGHPCGVGFEIDVDALVLELDLPQDLSGAIDWGDPRRLRATRAARYNWEARQSPEFCIAVPNPFLRGWVAQIFQIAALQVAMAEGVSLRDSLDYVADGARMDTLLNVLQAVFQVPDIESSEEGADKLRQKLDEALKTEAVRKAVRYASRVLVEPIDEGWNDWLALSIRATLGAACLEAIQQACPQIDPDGLIVDIDVRSDDGDPQPGFEIWISEVNPGGNGLIESVAELLATRPDSLYRHIEAALSRVTSSGQTLNCAR